MTLKTLYFMRMYFSQFLLMPRLGIFENTKNKTLILGDFRATMVFQYSNVRSIVYSAESVCDFLKMDKDNNQFIILFPN